MCAGAAPDAQEWRSLAMPKKELCLAFTLPTGQSFRWRKTGEDTYTGVIYQRVVSCSAPLHLSLHEAQHASQYPEMALPGDAQERAVPGIHTAIRTVLQMAQPGEDTCTGVIHQCVVRLLA